MITATLEQSKRLKELGAPQDTYFLWIEIVKKKKIEKGRTHSLVIRVQHERGIAGQATNTGESFAAYTLDELIEWLGQSFTGFFFLFDEQTYKAVGDYSPTPNETVGVAGKGETPLEAVYNLAVAIKSNHTGGE